MKLVERHSGSFQRAEGRVDPFNGGSVYVADQIRLIKNGFGSSTDWVSYVVWMTVNEYKRK